MKSVDNRESKDIPTPTGLELSLVVAVLLLATFFRTHLFLQAPPGLQHDEIFAANFASTVLKGEFPAFFDLNNGNEALFSYLVAIFITLMGHNYFALRLVSVFSGVLSIALAYRLTRSLFGRTVALLAAYCLAASFWHVFDSRVGLRAITLMTVELITFISLWRGLRASSTKGLILAGLFLGLTLYTYTSALMVPITVFLFVLYLLIFHRALTRPNLWRLALMFMVALLVFMPMGYHLYNSPAASTARVRDLGDHLRALLGGNPGPVLRDTISVIAMFGLRGDPEWRYNLAGRPALDPITGLLFYCGLVLSLWRFRRPEYAFLLLWLTLNLLPSAITRDSPSTLRAIGSLGAIYILPSLAIAFAWEKVKGKRLRMVSLGAVVALLLINPCLTYRDYFLSWANNTKVWEIYRGDLTMVAKYLDGLKGNDIAISGEFAADLDPGILNFVMKRPRPMRWFVGQRSLILPQVEELTYIFPATGPLRQGFRERYFSSLPTSASILQPDGQPAFLAYNIDEETLRDWRAIQPQHSLSINLDNQVEILGYELVSPPQAGEELRVILYWRVLAPAKSLDYSFFVHLLDNQGFIWAEDDSLGYPPSQWLRGDMAMEWFTLPILPDTPPRIYWLEVGMYSRTTAARLGVLGEATPTNAILLGPITLARAKAADIESLPIPQTRDINLDGRLTFLGYGLSQYHLNPGQWLHISLWWRADFAPAVDYGFFLLLEDEGGKAYGEAHRQPLEGEYPTNQWEAGEVVRDRFDFVIPPQTPPGIYSLCLKVADERGAYLPVTGTSQDCIDLGKIEILGREHEFAMPSLQHPVMAVLGNEVLLLGYEVATGGQAGQDLNLVLYWQAKKEMERSYTVFTHLIDEQGRIWGQKDNPPQGGTYPTTGWLEGEVVRDEYQVPIYLDTPPGTYFLEVGMYLLDTGERLPVLDQVGNLLGDRVLLDIPIRVE